MTIFLSLVIFLLTVALGYMVLCRKETHTLFNLRITQLECELDNNGRILDQFTAWLESPQGMVNVKQGALSRSTSDAACYDVFSRVDLVIHPGESAVVPTGIVTEMYNADALLLDRSGLAAKFRVTRRAGVIDSKYPDEWGVVLVNEGRLPYNVNAGDRIAQALFIPKFDIAVTGPGVVVGTTERKGGFGSTGK